MRHTAWSRRDVLKAAAAAPVLLPQAARAGAPSAPPWGLPAERPVRVEENAWIPMADGLRLSARIWLPAGRDDERAPVVMEYIPYRKRDLYRGHDDHWGHVLASHGIAYARVDVRGSGDSEGVLTDEYSEDELRDGVACIDWLSRQPWCTGAVGMRGVSWGGINTLQIAARNPPALRAIMPMGCCDNRYTDDAHYVGGALGHTNFQWGVLFKVVMAAPPDPAIAGPGWLEQWRARLQATPDILATWMSHQRFDDYWRRGSVALDLNSIKVPTYLVSGWQDTYSKPVFRMLGLLKCPRKCLIGPWGHNYPWAAQPQAVEWAREEIRWWEHWLRGTDTGIMQEPQFRTFMNYAAPSQVMPQPVPGRWIAEPSWPRRLAPVNLYLNGDRGLAAHAERSTRVVHRGGVVVGLTKPEWLDRPPVEQSLDDAKSLTFDTAPLAHDLEILGQPRLHVRVRSSKPVAQLAVRLTEVTPDGQSWLVSYGLLNLTRRDSFAAPQPLDPGEDYDIVVELFPIAHRFKRAHRLRIALSDGLWPLAWPSPEPADLAFTLGPHSRLELPKRMPEAVPASSELKDIVTPPEPGVKRPTTTLLPVEPGQYRIENNSPSHTNTIEATNTAMARQTWETSTLREGQPGTCSWSERVVSSWKRDDWQCSVEAAYELSLVGSSFRLVESLVAKHGEHIVADRRHEAVIPRDLL